MGGVSLGAGGDLGRPTRPSLPIGDGKVTTVGAAARLRLLLRQRFGAGRRPARGRRRPGRRALDPRRRHLRPDREGDGRRLGALAQREAARAADRPERRVFAGNGLPAGRRPANSRSSRATTPTATTATPTRSARRAIRYSLPAPPERPRRGRAASRWGRSASPRTASRSSTRSTRRTATRSPTRSRTTAAGTPAEWPLPLPRDPVLPDQGGIEAPASGLVGFALDGYPIYGPRGDGGKLLTNDDLDACHGQVSKVWLRRPLAAHLPLQRDARIPLHAGLLPRHSRSASFASRPVAGEPPRSGCRCLIGAGDSRVDAVRSVAPAVGEGLAPFDVLALLDRRSGGWPARSRRRRRRRWKASPRGPLSARWPSWPGRRCARRPAGKQASDPATCPAGPRQPAARGQPRPGRSPLRPRGRRRRSTRSRRRRRDPSTSAPATRP